MPAPPRYHPCRRRLGTPEALERVQNLYFAYLFVLRAVVKAGPILTELDYDTGLPEEDAKTRRLVQALVGARFRVGTARPAGSWALEPPLSGAGALRRLAPKSASPHNA